MRLPRSTPAEQGVDRRGIDEFVAALDGKPDIELHSLMVLRHGHVVAEQWWAPYRADSPHLLYSLSKSFTSTALGFAVAEGLVDLDAPVLSYFPEFDQRVTDRRSRSTRVRDVAAMASGHHDDMHAEAHRAGRGDLVLGLLLLPPKFEPGSFFAYNQPCTNTVAAIVRRVSGGSLVDFLRPRLFEPLDIRPYGWLTDPVGREQGYSGLHVTTEAIAKLGQLYLDRGQWQGTQLLPAAWVDEATRSHVATDRENSDWSQGYGFQFWRSRHGYRGDGAYGQYMVVLPDADAVVAITSQSPDMQAMLDQMWQHLLPALTATPSKSVSSSGHHAARTPHTGQGTPAPAEPTADDDASVSSSGHHAAQTPHAGVGALVLAGPVGDGSGGEIPSATFRARPGVGTGLPRAVRITPYEIVLTDDGPEVTAQLGGPGGWAVSGPIATAYAWSGGRLLIDVVFVETPHRLRLSLDVASSTFGARWQAEPLGQVPVGEMRMPR